MTWGAVGGAVVGVVGGAIASDRAGDAAGDAADAQLAAAAQSEALNKERFDEAQRMLSPYIQRSDIAQQQLMAELGLPVPAASPYMQEQNVRIRQDGVEAEIRAKLEERGIPQIITETSYVPGPKGSKQKRKRKVTNPEYTKAEAELRNQIGTDQSEIAAPWDRAPRYTDGKVGPNEQPIEGEYLQAPGTGYRATPSYQNLMGMYDDYGDVIGTPSYDAVKAPLLEYQKLVEGDSVRAPIDAYQQMLNESRQKYNEGVDVTNLPGYQKMIEERTGAVNQGAAGSGSLYSGRRGEALAEAGGATQQEFFRNYQNDERAYMGQQRDVAGTLSGIEQGRLGMQGGIYSAMSGIESDRMDRFAGLTQAKAGTENQFYTNYMNMLQNMASPQVAQNLSALGVNQGMAQGQQNIGAQQTASEYNLMGTGAQNAAIADIAKGGANIASAYMNRPQTPQQYTPTIIPQQTGYTNPNFSPAQGNYSPVPQVDFMAEF